MPYYIKSPNSWNEIQASKAKYHSKQAVMRRQTVELLLKEFLEQEDRELKTAADQSMFNRVLEHCTETIAFALAGQYDLSDEAREQQFKKRATDPKMTAFFRAFIYGAKEQDGDARNFFGYDEISLEQFCFQYLLGGYNGYSAKVTGTEVLVNESGTASYKLHINLPLESQPDASCRAAKEIVALLGKAAEEGIIESAKTLPALIDGEMPSDAALYEYGERFRHYAQFTAYLPSNMDIAHFEKLAELVKQINAITNKYGLQCEGAGPGDSALAGNVSLRRDFNEAGEYVPALVVADDPNALARNRDVAFYRYFKAAQRASVPFGWSTEAFICKQPESLQPILKAVSSAFHEYCCSKRVIFASRDTRVERHRALNRLVLALLMEPDASKAQLFDIALKHLEEIRKSHESWNLSAALGFTRSRLDRSLSYSLSCLYPEKRAEIALKVVGACPERFRPDLPARRQF